MVSPLVRWAVLPVLSGVLAAGTASAQVRSGFYAGNGASLSIGGLGFQPDFVLVKGDSASMRAVARTPTLAATKEMTGPLAAVAGLITSLDADGFSLGADARVNQAGIQYHWVAIRAVAGESAVGSYVGNGAASQSVLGLAFAPAYVLVLPLGPNPAYQRSSAMAGGLSLDFDLSAGDTDRIQALLGAGFQVGPHADVNAAGQSYHYVAWKATAGRLAVGAYSGDGGDNRSIAGAGFRPELVIAKRAGASGAVLKTASTGAAVDRTLPFGPAGSHPDGLQALEAGGFQVGTDPRVNQAGETYYWTARADLDVPLATTAAAATITVSAPARFEMRFNAATGGGIDEFFDLAEDPSRTFDLAGGTALTQALFNHSIEQGGTPHDSGQNSLGSKLELLEATPTRVRVRQEAFFQNPGSGILPSAKAAFDYSVHPAGRLALGWDRRTTNPVAYTRDDLQVSVHRTGTGPLSTWAAYGEANGVGFPGPGTDAFLLLTNDSPGVRTDFLTILHRDWSLGSGNFGAANSTTVFNDVGTERRIVSWREQTGGTIPPAFGDSWSLLTYFKPTDFVNHSEARSTSRRNDYRAPSAIAVGPGTQWQDAAEGTALAGDFFNEREAAYVFDMDPAGGLTFDINGSVATPRRAPFFKIRQWRSLEPPARVTLEGQPIFRDADYRADVKPVTRAHFVPELLWHCTFESATACDPGTLDVGSAGSVSASSHPAGRYGNAGEFAVDTHQATAGAPGSGDFNPVAGGIELWYLPYGAHVDGSRHLIWYNLSGFAPDFSCLGLEKDAANQLRLVAFVNYVDAACTTPDGNPPHTVAAAPSAAYRWHAREWVHLKTTWNAGAAAKKLRLLVNGVEVAFSAAYTAPATHGATVFGGCQLAPCPGGPGNAGGLIDEPHIYGGLTVSDEVQAPFAHGGLLSDAREFLANPALNTAIGLVPVDALFRGHYLYIGADSKFHGLQVDLLSAGAGASPGGLKWQYWNGAQWTDRESGGFTDTTESFQKSGRVFWLVDPTPWLPYSIDGGPDLYYVRVFLEGAAYGALPVERRIKTDILLFQHGADVTAPAQTVAFGPPSDVDLEVTKTDFQTDAVPGSSITYTVTVTNLGPDTVTSLTLNDALPAALASPAFLASAGSYDIGTGLWTGLTLGFGNSETLSISGTLDPFARGSITNTATVTAPPGANDSNGTNDVATDVDTLTPAVDVQLSKTDDVDPVPLGGLVTYTLTLANAGPSAATNVTLNDPLPAGMELDTGPGAILPSQGICNYDGPTRTVSCSLGDLAPAAVASVTIRVRAQAVGTHTNTATASRTETDTAVGNDSAGQPTTVEVSSLGVTVLTATSRSMQNVLEWINPVSAAYLSTEIVVRTDRFPTGPGDGATIYLSGAGGSGGRVQFPHATGVASNGLSFYYGAFVHRSAAPLVSPGRFVTGRPFDTTGSVKWAFSTGATAMTPPTVGGAGVIAPSNDGKLYAMERGALAPGGEWPATFEPLDVGVVQGRSPVVGILANPNPVVYLGSQNGDVYAIDAADGGAVPGLWTYTYTAGGMVQAAPGGIFGEFGGTLDYVLVGTRNSTSPNAYVALDPVTGAPIETFDNGGAGPGELGIITGTVAIEYGPPVYAYFTGYERVPVGSTLTLRAFELKASPDPVFTLSWGRALGNIDSSPVVRDGRVYVGSPLGVPPGTLFSIDAVDGNNTLLDRTFAHNDGQVRGFVWPDRASGDLYFATDSFVWGVTDTGAALVSKFAPISLGAGVTPSGVLFTPGSHYLYVGGSDGKLYEIDVQPAVPVVKSVTLGDGTARVGTPSLDRGVVPNLVHVGTEAGIFYAVQVPLP